MRKQTLVGVVATLTLILLVPSMASAQMRLMVSDPASNFKIGPIQKDLKLTEAQIKSLNDVSDKFRSEIQASLGSAMGSGKNPQSVIDEISAKSQKKVNGILTAPQKARYAEICFQVAAPSEFTREPIVSKLKITSAQKSQIEKVITEYSEQAKSMVSPGAPSKTNAAKLKANKSKARNKIIALLSKDQQEMLKKASGLPVAGLN